MQHGRHRKAIKKIRRNAPREVHVTGEITIEAREGGDQTPSFEIHAYNGGTLRVAGFEYPVVVELSTAKFEATEQTYINRHHDQKRELGHTTERRIDQTGIYVNGVLSHDNADTREIIVAAQRGKRFKASIEASFPPAQFVPRGKSVQVNNQKFLGPVYVARDATVTGVAILTRAADMGSNVKIAAKEGSSIMNAELKNFIEAQGFDVETLDEKQLGVFDEMMQLKAASSETTVQASAPVDFTAIREKSQQIAADEAERQSDIRRICAQYGEPEIELADGNMYSLAAHGIRNNMSAKEVLLEAKLYQADQKAGGGYAPAVHSDPEEDTRVIEAAMILSNSNVTPDELTKNRWYTEQEVDQAVSSKYQGYRYSRLAHTVMKAAGVYHPAGKLDDSFIEASVKAQRKLEATGSSFTTLSLPGIMRNVASKSMLAAFGRGTSIVPFLFGRTSASDFKAMYAYRLEGSGMLDKLPKDGEIKHGKLVESEYTKKLETYAKMLAFTRQDIINDDLGALTNVTSMLGVMAWKAREFMAVQTIATSSMFSTQNGNLLTGNDLSIAGLTASQAAFDAQVDADGLPISIDGNRILAPASLKVILSQLQNQTEIRDGGTGVSFTNNPHAGTFVGLASPWLDNAIATNNDANRSKTWYRFADPSQTPAFEIMYLNGRDTPTIQSAETDFNTLGFQWRCYWDMATGECDPRFAQKNVGS